MGDGVQVNEPNNADQAGKVLQLWLVDDSENFRVLLAALLEDEAALCCCQQFGCAEDALSALKTGNAPDVILLDVRMPGMGGPAAVRPIRELAPATHVLMLTTFGHPLIKAQALADGASDFLLKSYDVNEICTRIFSACSKPAPALSKPREVSVADCFEKESVGTNRTVERSRSDSTARRGASLRNAPNRFARGWDFIRSCWKSRMQGGASARVQDFYSAKMQK